MRTKNKLYGFIFLFFLTSCNNWLDVDLVNKVEESKLFKSEQGFREALAGVYSSMSKANMYGRRLTYGVVDVLAQTYDYSNMLEAYKNLRDYDYTSEAATKEIDSIWSQSYYTIALVNNILTWEASQGDVMKEDSRKQIKGEALALRAYLHFDLWRLYAPDIKQEPKAECLPYNREFGVDIPSLCSSEQFLTYCLADLEEALALLEADPIQGVVPYQLWDGIADNSKKKDEADLYVARMNFYAVKALMARIYLTKGSAEDKRKARTLAQEVIDSKKFALVNYSKSFTESESFKDALFSDEHIFSVRNKKIKDYVKAVMYVDNSGLDRKGNLQMPSTFMSEIFGGMEADFRAGTWVDKDNYKIKKYYQTDANNKVFIPKIPLIKLSEMYLIVAECWLEEDPGSAQGILEDLRKTRFIDGVGYELSYVNQDILLEEMRREYLCEGQLFFQYKRLNHDIIRRSVMQGDVKASKEVFVLPMPEKEIEDGKRDI